MTLDRRRFLGISAASIAGSLLAACDKNPEGAKPLLQLAERANEQVEGGLFRHSAMNHVGRMVALRGDKLEPAPLDLPLHVGGIH